MSQVCTHPLMLLRMLRTLPPCCLTQVRAGVPIACVSLPFNLLDTSAAATLLDLCRQHTIKVGGSTRRNVLLGNNVAMTCTRLHRVSPLALMRALMLAQGTDPHSAVHLLLLLPAQVFATGPTAHGLISESFIGTAAPDTAAAPLPGCDNLAAGLGMVARCATRPAPCCHC